MRTMNNGVINVIKASAGSGKTYNLARIYIANLLGTPTGATVVLNEQTCDKFKLRKGPMNYHRHLLAITFTNKATNEMKERIIKELYLLSKNEGDFSNDFKVMFEYSDFNDVVVAAQKALKSILFDYANFNVSTIDSFFQNILRNFARELDRDYNYDLQVDDEYATRVAVHEFLLELGDNTPKQAAINQWVKAFILNNINNKEEWNFFGKSGDLEEFASIIHKEFFSKRHADVINYLSDIGNGSKISKVATFRKLIAKAYNDQKDKFDKSIEDLRAFFPAHSIAVSDINQRLTLAKIVNGTVNELGSSEKTFRQYAQSEKALTSVLKAPASKNVLQNDIDDFKKLISKMINHLDRSRFFDNVLHNIWNLGLLGKINEKLEQYRKDTNTILIADTNELIGKALESGAHFIYEHVGNKFNNYMIDEFQDTSEKQYQNFDPLIRESLSKNYSNLIIGDEKQSIYRFRNSDSSLLRDKIDTDFAGYINPGTLKKNYRSFKSIVDFNNGLFEKIINDYTQNAPAYTSLIKTYANISQKKHKKGTGYVTVNFVPNEGGIKSKIFRALPAYINSILERGYKMSEIAILVSMKAEGREIIENIMRYNDSQTGSDKKRRINVISTESLMLMNSPSVKLILSVLRFLEISQYHLPEDNDETINDDFNKFLKRRVSEQRFFRILHDFEASVQNAAKDSDMGELLHQVIEKEREENKDVDYTKQFANYFESSQELMPDKKSQLSNLVNIVDKIIAKYILTSHNSDDNQELENSYILAFVDVVHDFAAKHNGGTIREFLQYWDANPNSFTIGSSSSLDAVNVMTIHKSKGLEFKCIIIPYAHWQIDKLNDVFWIQDHDWIDNCASLGITITDNSLVPPLIPVSTSILNSTGLFNDMVLEEKERCLIDNINKLYVALTRPKEELHVFALGPKSLNELKCDKGIKDIKYTSDLLLKFVPEIQIEEKPAEVKDVAYSLDYIADDTEPSEDVDVEKLNAMSCSFGTQATVTLTDEEDDTAAIVKDYWVSPQVLPVHVTVHQSSSARTDEGLRMHAIFGTIKSEHDFDKAIAFARNNNLLDKNSYWNEDRLTQLIDTIKCDNLLSEWFSDDNVCYNERKISFPSKDEKKAGTFEHRRPDRIVRRPNGDILVIDYKFGTNYTLKVLNKYKKQVSYYVQLMRQMGHHNVVGYIWYPRSGKIERVGID